MKKRITITVDPDLDDCVEASGIGKSLLYAIAAGVVKAYKNGELTNSRVYSVRCGKAAQTWRDYWEKNRAEICRYWEKVRGVTTEYLRGLESALDRKLEAVRAPEELGKNIAKAYTEGFINGLRGILNFIEWKGRDEFLGYSLDRWRKIIKGKPSGVDQRRLSDDELKAVVEGLDGDVLVWARALAYSGMRLKQLWEGLRLLKQRQEKDSFFKIPIAGISRGTKRGFFIYEPSWMLSDLKALDVSLTYKQLNHKLERKGVLAKYIRKWNYTYMRRMGVDAELVDYIQGRAPLTIGERHYQALNEMADEAYGEVIKRFPGFLRGKKLGPGPEGEPGPNSKSGFSQPYSDSVAPRAVMGD